MCFFGRSGTWSGVRSFCLYKPISVRRILRGVHAVVFAETHKGFCCGGFCFGTRRGLMQRALKLRYELRASQ